MLRECFKQELTAALADIRVALTSVLFFIFILCLLPVITDSTQQQLVQLAPGFIWLACLFATCLQIPHIFKEDAQSGVIYLYLTSPISLSLLIAIKALVHSLLPILMLLAIVPLFAMIYQLSLQTSCYLLSSLAIGLPILNLLGLCLSALLINSRQGSLFLMLLLLPLFCPVVILATSAVLAVGQGFDASGALSMLFALFCLSAVIFPPTIAACLRIGLE